MQYRYFQPKFNGRGVNFVHPMFGDKPADHEYEQVFSEDAPTQTREHTRDYAWCRHNMDDRPRGREIRSMSVGDIVEVEGTYSLVESEGWRDLTVEELPPNLR